VLSYVFMKILEGRPRSYDRRIDAVSRGRVLAMKQAVAEEVPLGASVLEIGCGTGELAELLCARGATVEGFDASPTMVQAARERVARAGLEGRLFVREMGVDGMDGLAGSSYGAVVATLVLSELTDDERRHALRHAMRVLEPGGKLVIADEVVPRGAVPRILHSVARVPLLVATYLATGASTTPVPDLRAEIEGAGFAIDKELRSHGDSFAMVVARRPEEAGA
jgi:demethylmenaquinone methyltransferase/2-methoxy-6-polyprenyl-1,4-benzoquinol methylase